MKPRKKVCFVITAQNQFARSVLILKELQKKKNIELQIIIGGSAILSNYGNVAALLKKADLPFSEQLSFVIEGKTPYAMAQTSGIAVTEFAGAFRRLEPDVVVLRGDRYEILSAAMAASYLNIPIAHLEGGDVTGTIDESVRHAVTKLAHVHFVTNEDAKKRVMRMGEPADRVFDVGAPEVEYAAVSHTVMSAEKINELGVGEHIDFDAPFLVVMNHPVTTEFEESGLNTQALLKAVDSLGVPTIWFWPNVDAGTDHVSAAIRKFRELAHERQRMHFVKYVEPEIFLALLAQTSCLVGNSSAGIKEASYLGTPVVNIGTRQQNRLRAENVIDVEGYDVNAIQEAVQTQLEHGRYSKSTIYYKKDSAKKIADVLADISVEVQKSFQD